MMRSTPGRASRRARTVTANSGVWASSSQDFVHLARRLFVQSGRYARDTDGNCSIYTLAGIPVLLSALRCLLIEFNAGMYTNAGESTDVLAALAASPSDVHVLLNRYTISPTLRDQLLLLLEVRHEIVHPAHRPGTELDGTPTYLAPLRQAAPGLRASYKLSSDNVSSELGDSA